MNRRTPHLGAAMLGVALASIFAAPRLARAQACVPDANGDGHPLFGNPEFLLPSHNPRGVALGDLNGDGRLDAVLANSQRHGSTVGVQHGNVGVMLGDGDGLFTEVGTYVVGSEPRSVALADLNGDSHLDMVVACGANDRIGVAFGNGDGTFGAASLYAVGNLPLSVVLADLDGDTDVDVAALSAMYAFPSAAVLGRVSVFLNTGNGSLAAPTLYAVGVCGDWPESSAETPLGHRMIGAGDVDGDGDIDLGTANYVGGSLSVLRNNGNGTFAPRVDLGVGSRPSSIAIGDLDGDLDADLIAGFDADVVNPGVCVVRNNGAGSFGAGENYLGLESGGSLAIGDFDADGDLDACLGHTVVLNDGDAHFTHEAIYDLHSGGPLSPAVGDLNGDGRPDLALVHFGPGATNERLLVFLNVGVGTFGGDENTTPFEPDARLMASGVSADLDQDGDLDLAVAARGNAGAGNAVAVYMNNGDGTLGALTAYAAGAGPRRVAAGDLDGDSYPDLAVANGNYFNDNTLSVLRNNGDGTFAPPESHDFGRPVMSVGFGDLTGDGRPEVLAGVYYPVETNTLAVLLNDGSGNLSNGPAYQARARPSSIVTADLDSDGTIDVVLSNRNGSDVTVFKGLGDGTLAAPAHYDVRAGGYGVAIADVDGDGDLDLAAAAEAATVLVNKGDGTFIGPFEYVAPVVKGGLSVDIADIDGDGRQDLALSNDNYSAAQVWMGKWGLAFGDVVFYGGGFGSASVMLEDLDEDGACDMALVNSSSDSVSVLRNRRCEPRMPGIATATGACCLPDASCLVVAPAACAAVAGGLYQGNGAVCVPGGCAQRRHTLTEVARFEPVEGFFVISWLNGRLFVSTTSVIYELDPMDPDVVLNSFTPGIGSIQGMAGDPASGLLLAIVWESDADGMYTIRRIDPDLEAVVGSLVVQTGGANYQLRGLSVHDGKLYTLTYDGSFQTPVFLREYGLGGGAALRSKDMTFLNPSNVWGAAVVDGRVLAAMDYGDMESGELHEFMLSDLSYIGRAYAPRWAQSVAYDGTHVWMAELVDYATYQLQLVKLAPHLAPACSADFNGNGTVTVGDLFAYLAAWFAQDPDADINDSGTVTPQDLFTFLAHWFAQC